MNTRTLAFSGIAIATLAGLGGGVQWLMSSQQPLTNATALQTPSESHVPNRPEASPAPLANQPQAEVARLQSEVATLREAVSLLLENQHFTQDTLDRLSAISVAPANTPAEQTTEENPEEVQKKMEQMADSYDERLKAENQDPQWAHETIEKLETGLRQEDLAGIKLVEANCGSTLCKVDLQLDPKLPREDSLQRLSTQRSWDGATFYTLDANGNMRLFFARDGYDLPQL